MLTPTQIQQALKLSGRELMDRCRQKQNAGELTAEEAHMLYEHWLYERGYRNDGHGFAKMTRQDDLESVAREIGII